ncbi:unnamed protein product [Rotaria sp. Silwood2]|nr:unnamed protein product [Rotaria sp. Silwood2]CAF4047867.1 unnamed protein product [Rotaria sp. Silwood2]
MNHSDIHFLDLPNEILIIILKKLGNVDVLYSLFGIKNERIDTLLEDSVFRNILDFVRTPPITDEKLDRFCTDILPQRHHYIKKLIVDTTYMKRILLASDYPNLNSLELFSFGQDIVFRYFTDDSIFQHIFKYQITDLILHNNDEDLGEMSLNTYIVNVYARIMVLFQNLKHLTVVPSPVNHYPPLSLCIQEPTIDFSSTLTVLCIKVLSFYDCLALLDGRLKQLNTFIVQVVYVNRPFNSSIHYPSITSNMVS